MKKAGPDPTDRRRVLKLLGALPLAGGFTLSEAQAESAHERLAKQAVSGAYTPKFFTPHEWDTVRLLVDIIIPRDARSGSATDAKVPEFMDFILNDPLAEPRQREENQVQMRGGLAWLDRECARRFSGRSFLEASETERKAVLDSIAYPKEKDAHADRATTPSAPAMVYPSDKTPVLGPGNAAGTKDAGNDAAEERALDLDRLSHGIAFFTEFRDLTASGFWSSAMGVKDLGYLGNVALGEWKGCPTEVLEKLGFKA